MIKKIIIFAFVLLLVVVPSVLGDAAPPPLIHNGNLVNINYDIKNTEVEIDGQFSVEITIENLTNHKVILYTLYGLTSGYLRALKDTIDSEDLYLGIYIIIKPYESFKFEAVEVLDADKLDCYKFGSKYYVDFDPRFTFSVDQNDDGCNGFDEDYIERMETPIPFEITNLNDGSEFLEFKWLDEREIMYYYDEPDWTEDQDWSVGQGYYKANIKNVSDKNIMDIKPNEEKIINEWFYSYDYTDEVEDIKTNYFREIFIVDGEYYGIEYSRDYLVDFLEPPDVNVEKSLVEIEDDEYVSKLLVKATNITDEAIEDFAIGLEYFDEISICYVYESGDLLPGETLTLEYYFKEDSYIEDITLGYFIEGVSYSWWLYLYGSDFNDLYEFGNADAANYDLDQMHVSEYEKYQEWRKKKENEENSNQSSEPRENITASPNVMVVTTSEVSPTEHTTVTILKRQNPMLWLLAAVLVLSAAAVIMKKDREKRDMTKR